MRLSYPSRFVIAVIALFCAVFTQFAVASYVCPMLTGNDIAAKRALVAMDRGSMSDCGGMDIAQVGLCHAHTHNLTNKHSLDKPDVPAVSPFIAAGFVSMPGRLEYRLLSFHTAPQSSLLARATAPPLAVRHCCFRI
jgi:hypothetical protein